MSLDLDHVFVFAAPDAPEFERLRGFGLVEGFRREHPGQGTRNVCTCFANAYLELIWVFDEAEVRAPECAALGLWERSRWRETGACPFGFALRRTDPDAALPFDTVAYTPSYLPPGVELSIAAPGAADQPLVFVVPAQSGRPAGATIQDAVSLTGLRVQTPEPDAVLNSMRDAITGPELHAEDAILIQSGDPPHVHVELTRHPSGETGPVETADAAGSHAETPGALDLRPEVALSLSWTGPTSPRPFAPE